MNVGQRILVGVAALFISESFASAQDALVPGRLATQVQFNQPVPLIQNSVLTLRLLSPPERARQGAALAAKGAALAAYPLDLGSERFSVYLPKREPASGYGLLVFIPPWEDAHLPQGWSRVLDATGFIFVSAERSGNAQDIAGRRIPLALASALSLIGKYRIDPDRVLIGGFSGGSRVALRLALAFPDVFAGVLLNSGSDPVANGNDPLPSPELMSLLQKRTRFVYATGENDEINVSQDARSRVSLSAWCINRTRVVMRPHTGHEVMNADALAESLGALLRGFTDDPDQQRCEAALATHLQQAQAAAETLRSQPLNSAAQQQLKRLELQYGGLL